MHASIYTRLHCSHYPTLISSLHTSNSYPSHQSHVQNISKRGPRAIYSINKSSPSSSSSSSKVSRTNAEMLHKNHAHNPKNKSCNSAAPHIFQKIIEGGGVKFRKREGSF
ncbi:hypothetical protein HDV62DRAFT_362590 [Trichoderma sp. SZMC 28011]